MITAVSLSTCYSQGDMSEPDGTGPSCQILRDQFSFLMCNDSGRPDRSFQQRQCETNEVCYCVDPMTGDRIDGMSYTREEFARIDCNDNDGTGNTRRNMTCPDLTDTIRACRGRNCVRRPNNDESCLQCIEGCTGDGQAPRCGRDSECDGGERCIITGDLGRSDCIDVRIQEGEACAPDDNQYGVDDDELERSIRNFDRHSELGERECSDSLVCRRNDLDATICQNRTGTCFENNRQLECNDDSGDFEARQSNNREHWCVYPMNGTEVPGTRRDVSESLDCNRIVFQNCQIMIDGRQYTVEHGNEAVNFNMTRDICRRCRCNNGTFTVCSQVQCLYTRDSETRPCTVNGRTVPHRGTYEVECNMCRCINDIDRCTQRDCSDDEADDDDRVDEDSDFAECRRMPYTPVCAANMRTYPNKCTALAAGFERFEITPGACSRDSICERFPCMSGQRCVPLGVSCARRRCTARDFRRCINVTQLMCRAELNSSTEQTVCGMNNRTYPSICHLVQQSSTQIRFMGSCDRSDCPDSPVCGTDGVTYRSICDLRLQPDVRLDYRGACTDVRNELESVRDFCVRVRNSNRCATQQNCNTTVRPTDGCCPICGGGVSVGIDEEAFSGFSEEFGDVRTTSEVRRRMTGSGIVRDTSGKCNMEAQFASNGDIELFYEAVSARDAFTCASRARMTADNINNFGRANTNRRRRQMEGEDADPIFNFVTVAAAMETTSITGPTNPSGSSASAIIIASRSLLLALILFAMLMF